MGALTQANRTSPIILTGKWLADQPKTLQGEVRRGMGFLPREVALGVWAEAAWSESSMAVWFFGVEA